MVTHFTDQIHQGGFQLEFVRLKLQHSDWRANLAKDFFLQINFPPMRALEFITGHVIFKLCYNQIYQLKTTNKDFVYLSFEHLKKS